MNIYGSAGVHAYRSTVSNCVIRNTLVPDVSAVSLLGGSTAIWCAVELNAGNGIGVVSGSVVLNSRIAGNNGRGVYLLDGTRLSGSIVYGNRYDGNGGGVWMRGSVIENCVIAGNACTNNGGGVYVESFTNRIVNCTIADNVASNLGGGVYCYRDVSNINTVIMYNRAGVAASSNYYNDGFGIQYMACCSAPIPPGSAGNMNFVGDPRFADAAGVDYHLTAGSACINGGFTPLAAGDEDCEGVQRVISGIVDVGAHEYVPLLVPASPVHYVDGNGGNVWPYTNAAAAARTVQAALDTADNGDRVLVAPGLYRRNYATYRGLKSRAATVRAVSVEAQSSNTPAATILLGEADVGGGPGTNGFAMRCATLTNGVTLTGFLLSNGCTRSMSSPANYLSAGGGALCDLGGVVSRCIIAANQAEYSAGGVMLYYRGEVRDSVLSDNTAVRGGGALMYYGGRARNCLAVRNRATTGGGLYCDGGGTLESCTIADNAAQSAAGGVLLWSERTTNYNNIVYGNAAPSYPDCQLLFGSLGYSCTYPLPSGPYNGGGNISNAPWFVNSAAGDYRVQPGSPTIDAGTNLPWMAGAADLDGNPRIVDSRVDMGCYEFVPEPAAALLAVPGILLVLRKAGARRVRLTS